MSERLFLCTDLDRTLIPNGPQPESPEARQRFRQLCAWDRLTLAYVSGRHRSLVKKAIVNYSLPQPDYVVGDVGTTIYRVEGPDDWHHLSEWEAHIGEDWAGRSQRELSRLFTDLTALRLQENSKQNRYKLSYYISLHSDRGDIEHIMCERLHAVGVKATLVWSVDEPAGVGLLDVLPARASKLHAIEFLMQSLGFDRSEMLFSGDSGNDMQVLVSDIPAVLVRNAPPEVREAAHRSAAANDNLNALYLAKGGFMQMNGNYSAGILEGVAHYHPQLARTILADRDERGGLDG
jgi:HAD superfamily hydrolase (TIGR01484 family)